MNATSFNPLEVARELKAAGIDSHQAETLAEAMRKAAIADRDEIATKADIYGLDGRITGLDGRITGLDGRITGLDQRITALRSEMRWMFGFMAALILAMAGKMFGVV